MFIILQNDVTKHFSAFQSFEKLKEESLIKHSQF